MSDDVTITTIGEARGFRAELVSWLRSQEWTYRIVDARSGHVLEAEWLGRCSWYHDTRAAGRAALARFIGTRLCAAGFHRFNAHGLCSRCHGRRT